MGLLGNTYKSNTINEKIRFKERFKEKDDNPVSVYKPIQANFTPSNFNKIISDLNHIEL